MGSVPGRRGPEDPRFETITSGASKVLDTLPFDELSALNILALAAAMQIKMMSTGEAHEAALLKVFAEGVKGNLLHCLRIETAH